MAPAASAREKRTANRFDKDDRRTRTRPRPKAKDQEHQEQPRANIALTTSWCPWWCQWGGFVRAPRAAAAVHRMEDPVLEPEEYVTLWLQLTASARELRIPFFIVSGVVTVPAACCELTPMSAVSLSEIPGRYAGLEDRGSETKFSASCAWCQSRESSEGTPMRPPSGKDLAERIYQRKAKRIRARADMTRKGDVTGSDGKQHGNRATRR